MDRTLNINWRGLDDKSIKDENWEQYIEIYCAYNEFTKLPKFSICLDLFCNDNRLTSLNLSNSLLYLRCAYNQIIEFTGAELPLNLILLNCSNNKLTGLPILPKTLQFLYCSDNKLTCLPELPDSLIVLSCKNNHIEKFPNFPPNLTNLEYDDNLFNTLPDLPWTCKINNHYEMLYQYNHKRKVLGMTPVITLCGKSQWDEINKKYFEWKYRVDGQIFQKSLTSFKGL